MGIKKLSLIGKDINEFHKDVENKHGYSGQKARLIPTYNFGNEMALTSTFLSSVRLIKEFRKSIFSTINLSNAGKIHVFTEFAFIDENKRVDGLIVIERGNKIIDAALLEMKNGKVVLDENQIRDYVDIADKYSIPTLVTVSNQFVSTPSQSPLIGIKPKKSVSMFHLSWSYILTLCYVLLTDNETNIEDPDQVEIMKEVVDCFEHPGSGVLGFTEMKAGWVNTSKRLMKGEKPKKDDEDILGAVESWLQEEKDMALKLSMQLGSFVTSGNPKYKNDLKARIESDAKKILADEKLESILKISGAASNIVVIADFSKRSFEFKTSLTAPQDRKTIKGQVGWLKTQLKKMDAKAKNDPGYSAVKEKLIIDLKIKNKQSQRKSIDQLDQFCIDFKNDTLKDFEIVLCCDVGSRFAQKRKVLDDIESSLSDYYKYIVKHLTKWVKPAPEIKNPVIEPTE